VALYLVRPPPALPLAAHLTFLPFPGSLGLTCRCVFVRGQRPLSNPRLRALCVSVPLFCNSREIFFGLCHLPSSLRLFPGKVTFFYCARLLSLPVQESSAAMRFCRNLRSSRRKPGGRICMEQASFINFSQLFVFFWFTLLSSLFRDVISDRDASGKRFAHPRPTIRDLRRNVGATGAPN